MEHTGAIEQFKNIEGWPNYKVSNLGRVVSTKHGKENVLSPMKNWGGYVSVGLSNVTVKRYLIHRLVALAFIPNPNNYPQINHKNGIRTDNRADNLEWCTGSQNQKHAFKYLGRKPFSPWLGKYDSDNPKSKPVIQKDKQGNIIRRWDSMMQAERIGGFWANHIGKVTKGKLATHGGFKWELA